MQLGERLPCLVCAVGERLPCLVCEVGGKAALLGVCSWGKGFYAWYVQLGERLPCLVCAVGERVLCIGEMGHLHFQGSSPHSELKALKQGL